MKNRPRCCICHDPLFLVDGRVEHWHCGECRAVLARMTDAHGTELLMPTPDGQEERIARYAEIVRRGGRLFEDARPKRFAPKLFALTEEDTDMLCASAPARLVGFSWDDVGTQARHVVHLLETQGENALGVVTGILKLIKLATSRDMIGVFQQLNQTVVDVQALAQAVKDEFSLN